MRGLEIARKTDDKLYIYLILEPLASATVNFDVQKSLELFQEMYEVAQDLNVSYMIGEVLYDSAFPFGTAGEYDLAISSIEEAIKTLGSADDTDWLFLSRIYAVLGDGQRALEWVNRAFEDSGQVEYPRLYLNKSWALALLNRVEEAESNLETAYSLILKTGKEFELGLYYHGAGVIERTKTNYQAALDFFEKAKEIFDRLTVGYHNIILLDLAQTEILNSSQSIDSKQSVIQGKWLLRLEKHAIDRNLPGLRMQAAMLKAEFYAKHKLFRDARAILVDALDITDSPGVKTLRKMIKSRILELNHFIGEEETLP